jgi:predicted HTH domain antitoxin
MATPSSLLRLSFDHIEASDQWLVSGYSADELGQILGEQLLIARYKSGDFSLGEVSEMLGFYPDIARTRQWLNDRGVVQEYSATERAHLEQSAHALFAELGIPSNG